MTYPRLQRTGIARFAVVLSAATATHRTTLEYFCEWTTCACNAPASDDSRLACPQQPQCTEQPL